MEDLDLDELDQAVTQLMDQPKGKKAAKKPAPKIPPAAPVEAPKPAAEPVQVARVTLDKPIAVTRPLAKPAPRKRIRPGAMDIVQRPAPSPAPPSQRPARQAAAVQPTRPIAAERPQPQPVPPTPTQPAPEDVSDDVLASLNMHEDSNKTVKPKPEPVAPQPPAAEVWPDPIDLHGFDDTKPQTSIQPEQPPEKPPTLESDEPLLAAPPEPTPSPFVTTKVEKRPLGAYAAPPAPEQTSEPSPPPKEEPTKAEMAEASLQSSQHLEASHEPEADGLRQMAIPQQYHAAEAKPSDAVHHVFDTKEYHAPPQPMRTERSGGPGLVVGVVVIIVLIVGLVAVGYLMMSGMLDIGTIW